jgi:CRISPR/Cas system-associated endonuclease Cas1
LEQWGLWLHWLYWPLSCSSPFGLVDNQNQRGKIHASRGWRLGSDGFITLEALRWISDVGAAFVMLDRRGKVLAVTGPVAPSDAKLRRAQALALGNGTGLRISKELISQKLAGQEILVRDMLHDSASADTIARFRDELPRAESLEVVRLIESQAARSLLAIVECPADSLAPQG